MATCNCGRVEVVCPAGCGCGCICTSDPPIKCWVWCDCPQGDGATIVKMAGDFEPSLGTKVDFNCKGVKLASLAKLLDDVLGVGISVPAAILDKKPTISLTATLSEVVEALGFKYLEAPRGEGPQVQRT